MKKMRAMAAIVAAAATLAMGALPVCAADNAQDVQALRAAIAADAEVQSELAALADEAAVSYKAFEWGESDEGAIAATAYKVDLESTSMANDSLDSGSSYVYDSDNSSYILTIKTKSVKRGLGSLTLSAKPKSATVTYATNQSGALQTVNAVVSQSENTITVAIPEEAFGFAKADGTIPGNYANMVKVYMKTTLEDNAVASALLPEAMISPTFYYAFNVVEQ